MASVVVNPCVYHRLHVDYGRYLSAQGLAHRQHNHGRSMSTSGEIALEIALRLQNHMKIARVREGYNSGQVARNTFFTKHCKVRLAKDGNHVTGGYVVLHGELMGFWCNNKGSGKWLLRAALADGAVSLNCFDGFLVSFYASEGFYIVRREPNLNVGGPDVVFMEKEGRNVAKE